MKNNKTDMKTFKRNNTSVLEPISSQYRANIEPTSRDNRVSSRRFGLLFTLIFMLGIGNMWGASTVNGGYIYFDASTSGWSVSDVQFVIGHNTYSQFYNMTHITNTDLYYISATSWGDATYFAFANGCSTWGAEANKYDSRKTWITGKYTKENTSYTLNSGSYYLFYASSSSNNATITTSDPAGYLGNSNSYTALNYAQTLYQYVSTNGGSTYSASTANIGTIAIATKYLSGATTTANHNVSITSGNSSTNTTAARTATVTMTITDVADGYAFQGWYSAASGGSKLESDLTYTYKASTTKSVYARFIKETTYTITIANSVNGTTSTTQVGATPVQITAPEIAGYNFANWSAMPSGVTKTSGNLTDQSIYISATKAATVTANYTEDLNSTYYLVGDAGPFASMTWTASPTNMMKKKTGSSTASDVYINVTVTQAQVDAATTYPFKIYNSAESVERAKWIGKGTGSTYTTITKRLNYLETAATTLQFSTSTDYNNVLFRPTIAGTYEFHVNYSTAASPTVTIKWPDVNQIQITYGDASTPVGYYNFDSNDGTHYYKTFTFNKDRRYSAKILFHSDFYTFNTESDMTIDSHTGWRIYNNQSKICNVWTPADGDYQYDVYTSGGNTYLTVTYPEFFRTYFDADVVNPNEDDSIAVWPVRNPSIPASGYVVCYELQYSNGDPVSPEHEAVVSVDAGHQPHQARFYVGDLAAGTYKVKATLRSGTSCSAGTEQATCTETFRVASDYTVTIKYMCGEDVIKTQTTMVGSPTQWTDITAPNIIGYTFSSWEAGDGITLYSAKTVKANKFKANYDGTLIAKYTKRRVIYFNNTYTRWSSVNVYFYSGPYWDASKGTGSQTGGAFTGKSGAMTKIEGTNIWYYDCETNGVSSSYTTVAFTEALQNNYEFFSYKSGTTPNKVVYRGDYNTTLPMFVPITQTGTSMNGGRATYYNNGYWMNYPENTGYTLHVYSKIEGDGTVEVATIPFEFTEDCTLPMSIDVLLDAAHTYGYKVERADNTWYGNNGTMQTTNCGDPDKGHDPWALTTGTKNCGLLTTAAGTYTFTLSYGESSGYNYLMGVKYPAEVGDFRVLYKDRATWSQETAHTAAWGHPSRVIPHKANAVDTISFFVAKGSTPTLQLQRVKNINASTGAVTWENVGSATSINDVTEIGVYNFRVVQNSGATSATITNIGAYEGKYYIRGGAFSNKWENYLNNNDHLMTYSAFSESDENSFGEKFSHYKAKWCPRGTNVKFCIANDYSPCISDTLLYDVPNSFSNINADGTLKTDGSSDDTADKYSANIRFMWNRKTNKISRAYVASATNVTKKFLVLQGDARMRDADGNAIAATAYIPANAALLQDDQNWIYEVTIKAQPTARIKLYACYTTTTVADAQYFRGTNAAFSDASTIQILGGTGDTYYPMRIIYDFKTNRLITAWMPDGSDISGDLHIQTDVMIIREHQEDAQCITFANDASKLSEVKTVYGTMRFNRWTLNNRGGADDHVKEHCNTTAAISQYHPVLDEQKSVYERFLYFISFPFDVELNEVFGFGTYGTHWVISTYNGERRARIGYFRDNCPNGDHDCTNWDYIWDRTGVTLEAGKGYLLSLEPELMAYDDTTNFWINQIQQVELYFPSKQTLDVIQKTEYTMPALGDEYICTINHNTDGTNPEGDRRVKDSYWRCIGVPSFANYSNELTKGKGGATINWQTNHEWRADFKDFPFLYEWNTTDNSIMARATSTYTFRPTFAYLVQNGNAIHWTNVNKKASIVARKHAESASDYTWCITLSKNGKLEDQTYVRMSDDERVTKSFDFGQDLAKEYKIGAWDDKTPIVYSNIYSFATTSIADTVSTDKLAANSLPLNTTEKTIVPLGLNIATEGTYTIALPEGANGIGLTLIDSETGERTNLAAGLEYNVHLNKADYDTRFSLEISPVQDMPTEIGNVQGDEVQSTKARKMLIDGVLYIVRDGNIYDCRGVLVH